MQSEGSDVGVNEVADEDRLTPRVQTLVGSPDDRVALLLELAAAARDVRARVDAVTARPFDEDALSRALDELDHVVRPIATSLAWVASWGLAQHDRVVLDTLRRLADVADQLSGVSTWLELRRWPAVVALAGVGTAAVDAGREHLLGRVLTSVVVREPQSPLPAALALQPEEALDAGLARRLPGRERQHTPVDNMVEERLRGWLVPDLIGSPSQLVDSFDRYQFLAGAVAFDERAQRLGRGWAPVGAFGWRHRYGWALPQEASGELERLGPGWPLLVGGAFGGDPQRAREALAAYTALVERAGQSRY